MCEGSAGTQKLQDVIKQAHLRELPAEFVAMFDAALSQRCCTDVWYGDTMYELVHLLEPYDIEFFSQ